MFKTVHLVFCEVKIISNDIFHCNTPITNPHTYLSKFLKTAQSLFVTIARYFHKQVIYIMLFYAAASKRRLSLYPTVIRLKYVTQGKPHDCFFRALNHFCVVFERFWVRVFLGRPKMPQFVTQKPEQPTKVPLWSVRGAVVGERLHRAKKRKQEELAVQD